jgi:hypothetical protein
MTIWAGADKLFRKVEVKDNIGSTSSEKTGLKKFSSAL